MNIVIVGGGFAGIKTALKLSKQKDISVTLISDKDYFVYYPALYSVATGGSNASSFVPLDDMLAGTDVKLIIDTITYYDPASKLVSSKDKSYSYDTVVFALGVVTTYFGIDGLDKYSYSIKTLAELDSFKRHIHTQLSEDKASERTYVVVGAGPTGVELSASLNDYVTLFQKEHGAHNHKIRIRLIEAAPTVLPKLHPKSSAKVVARLKSLGVHVMAGKMVESQDEHGLTVSGKRIDTHTVIWTSGVTNHPFFKAHSSHFEFAKNGKVIVDEHLMTDSNTYVIADNAATQYSGLAQIAIHDGIYTAKDIVRKLRGKTRPAYTTILPPVVIPVGAHWAVLEWGKVRFAGYAGYLMRKAADFIGYSDILPIGLAFGSWRASERYEEKCPYCETV